MGNHAVSSNRGDHAKLVARLKEVLATKKAEGWTARSWSLAAGLEPDAVRNILRGRSLSPRIATLEALARAAEVPLEWLRGMIDELALSADHDMRPEGRSDRGTLPLIGYIGAGDTIFHFGIGEARERVPAPPDVARGIAAQVRGSSMLPVYRDNDLVIGTEHQGAIEDLVGSDCFVQVQDGPLYLKILRKGTKGRFTLESYNNAVPPILGQAVEWAAPVSWVKRRWR